MTNFIFILRNLYLPYVIMGIIGGIIFFFNSSCQKRLHIFIIAICISIMFFWRIKYFGLNSSRYSENLIVITVVSSAFFILNWDSSFFNRNRSHSKKRIAISSKLLIAATIVCLIVYFNFSHYNLFYNNYHNIRECITFYQVSPQKAAIITPKDQRLYNCGIPQISIPFYLLKDTNISSRVLNAVRHFQWLYNHLFIVSEWNPRSIIHEVKERNSLRLIGTFIKNKKKKHIYLYSYDSPRLIESLNVISTASYSEDDDNLFVNGGFEKERFRNSSEKKYYDKINQQGPAKRNAIPSNKYFPLGWDIYWANGFSSETIASIYTIEDPVISGTRSLFLKANDTISFLSERRLKSDNYLFQCDILPLEMTTFGIQFSLRDDQNELAGFRKINEVLLYKTKQKYHYSLFIPKEMFYPYNYFYFYFYIYGAGNIIIDNFSLTRFER